MCKVVMISAKANHGKDELAKYIKRMLESHGKSVAIDRFAKYIKSYLKDYYGWDGENKNEYYRNKLQQLGTDIIKEELNYKAFHVKRLAEDIQIVSKDFDYVLIPDTRFRDEVYHMKAMFPDDCITVRVNRLGFESKLTDYQKKHKSEVDLDGFIFDYTIDAEDGISSLHRACDNVLGDVLGYLD